MLTCQCGLVKRITPVIGYDKLTDDSVATNPKRTFMQTRLRLISWLFLVAAGVVGLARSGAAEVMDRSNRVDGQCDPVFLALEFFDGVTPPALPTGWLSTTWVTSNSGVPTPPADTVPNAAVVDDPSTTSDKRLDSPSIFLIEGGEPVQITFRNNFNLQDGFDGGVLELSPDGGNTFQDILSFGSFLSGGYNGMISNCCSNPLAGRQVWTGSSGGFITTTVNLRVTWGPSMVLRWRMGSDSSVSGEGWRVDTVVITQCHKPVPTPPPPPRTTPTPRSRPSPAPRP